MWLYILVGLLMLVVLMVVSEFFHIQRGHSSYKVFKWLYKVTRAEKVRW